MQKNRVDVQLGSFVVEVVCEVWLFSFTCEILPMLYQIPDKDSMFIIHAASMVSSMLVWCCLCVRKGRVTGSRCNRSQSNPSGGRESIKVRSDTCFVRTRHVNYTSRWHQGDRLPIRLSPTFRTFNFWYRLSCSFDERSGHHWQGRNWKISTLYGTITGHVSPSSSWSVVWSMTSLDECVDWSSVDTESGK